MSADAAVQALKEKGNLAYRAGKYADAVNFYSEAIQKDPSNAALFSNRSLSNLLLGKHAEALADAQQAAKLKPEWEKGHFRCGAALEAMGDLAKALPAYERALDLNPMSAEIIAKVRELKKKVQPKQPKRPGGGGGGMPEIHQVPAGGVRTPGPADWAVGLSPDKQAEWLCDCYRMRVEDDFAWGGGNLHGLYEVSVNPDRPGKNVVCEDFLLFCKLAVVHRVVPHGWDWGRFLRVAVGLLPYAFEKSDAQEKWGGENVFSVMMGGRSLRYTGEVVYGSSIMGAGHGAGVGKGDGGAAFEQLSRQVEGQWKQLVKRDGQVFADVGGVAVWKQLHSALQLQTAGYGYDYEVY